MKNLKEKYIVDEKGRKKAVVIKDIMAGRLSESVFAADLGDVVQGKAI